MQLMKVLFVHEGYISKHNNGYYSLHYSNAIIERYKTIAEEVTFLTREETFDTNKKNQNKLNIEGFSFIGLKNYKTLKGIKDYFSTCKTIEKSVKTTDFLVARLPGDLGNLAIKFAKKHRKTYTVELVGCPWDALWNHSWKGRLVAPFMWYATKKAIKNAPYVVYVTNEYLQGRYPCKGKTIGCSDVSLPTLDKNILRKRLNKIHYTSDNKPVVLGTAAAVNVRYKGQEYVIQAIAKLNKQGYDFEYHLAGGGDNSFLKFVAEKYGVTDKVKFIGSLTHEKIFNYLDDIDIYIQPSNTEGMPRALIEAMSRGCPCIGSSSGGIPELLDKDYIFTRGNFKEMIPILAGLNKNKMFEQAKRNFEFSKRFDQKVLEARRNEFLLSFKKYADQDLQGENK